MATENNGRHGCLSIWLFLLMLWNLALILTYTGCNMVEWVGDTGEPFGWYYPVMIAFAVLSLIFIFAIFRWSRWGFWGLIVVNLVKLILEVMSGGSNFTVIAGIIVTMLILIAVLNMGRQNKGWPQLR